MKHILFLINPVNHNGDFVYLIQNASTVVKLVLLLLLSFSIISWAVIIFKLMEYSPGQEKQPAFPGIFQEKQEFQRNQQHQVALRQQPPG